MPRDAPGPLPHGRRRWRAHPFPPDREGTDSGAGRRAELHEGVHLDARVGSHARLDEGARAHRRRSRRQAGGSSRRRRGPSDTAVRAPRSAPLHRAAARRPRRSRSSKRWRRGWARRISWSGCATWRSRYNVIGQPKQAFPLIERAQRMAELLEDAEEKVRVNAVLASAYSRTYAYEEALRLLRDIVAACENGVLNDPAFHFRRLVDLALVLTNLRQPKQALAAYERAIALAEKFRDRPSLGAPIRRHGKDASGPGRSRGRDRLQPEEPPDLRGARAVRSGRLHAR